MRAASIPRSLCAIQLVNANPGKEDSPPGYFANTQAAS
jgi:hypothetical protein